MDGEALVGHVVPVLRSGNILEVRRHVASLVAHLRGMHDDLNVAAEIICERMKGPKASSDVVGLALAGAAATLEAVPRIDLHDRAPWRTTATSAASSSHSSCGR